MWNATSQMKQFDTSGNLIETSYQASTVYRKNEAENETTQGQNKSHSDKRILISKKKSKGIPKMLYNYNSSSNSKSFINLETKLKSGEKAYIDKSRGHVRQKSDQSEFLKNKRKAINQDLPQSLKMNRTQPDLKKAKHIFANNFSHRPKLSHSPRIGKDHDKMKRNTQIIGKAIRSSLKSKNDSIAPIVEAVDESTNTKFDFKSKEIRDSCDTKLMSNKFEHGTVLQNIQVASPSENKEDIKNLDEHESDFEEENVHLQPYSERSKITDNSKDIKSNKKVKNIKSFVVERLYTVKSDDKRNDRYRLKNDKIKVEENTPQSKYNKALENLLIDPFITNGLKGHKTIVHSDKSLFPPFKKLQKHRHSNSDTLIKSSSFKSSHQNQLVSKYNKNLTAPNNPALVICKKQLAKQMTFNSQHRVKN